MKKLNLQLGNIKEMLSKEQMKKIAGGATVYDSVECTWLEYPIIPHDYDCAEEHGPLPYNDPPPVNNHPLNVWWCDAQCNAKYGALACQFCE